MAIQTLWDTGSDYPITPSMDGGVYGTGIADCVCKGIGDEFTLNYSSDSLTVQFNAGSQCIIGGAFFKVMSLEALTLQANSTIYLCANINKSNANGVKGSFAQRTSSNMQSQNINGTGSSRDLLLYVVTTSGSGVSNVSDRRVIKGDGGSAIGGLSLDVGTNNFSASNEGGSQVGFNVTNNTFTSSSSQGTSSFLVNANTFQATSSQGTASFSVTNDSNGNYFGASAGNKHVGVWFTGNSSSHSATFTNGSTNLSIGVADKRVDVTDGSHTLRFMVLTRAQYNTVSKDGNMLYFVTEN